MPFREGAQPNRIQDLLLRPPPAFARLLDREGLAPLWHAWIAEGDGRYAVHSELADELQRCRRAGIVRYLLQTHAAQRVSRSLGGAGIRYAGFKGVAVRERIYADASLRPADDLDILLDQEQAPAAIRALAEDGFRFQPERSIISHEAALCDLGASVDVHWSLFRPGRSRLDLTPRLLETVRPGTPVPALSDDANLFVLLVHPAFAKHVNGVSSRLVRAVELDRMLRLVTPDWSWILSLIDAAGLRVAAWAVLHWTRLLMDTPVDPVVLSYLEPAKAQRRYLAYWIDRRLPARLGGVPGLVQGGFTLVLHERPRDAMRAVVALARARAAAGPTLRRMQRAAELGSGSSGSH